ncbi:MAG: radical SAM protein [Acidobacteria bacterium]|nr:radical SAM protein [Acidobacteriota bacterium]
MQPSMFNVRVPVNTAANSGDVFLMNTFTDAQLIVSSDVAALLDRAGDGPAAGSTADERRALSTLAEHGFLVRDRPTERQQLEAFFQDVRERTSQFRLTVLTTLQCNFACDYCFQGDHGDHNKFAAKMSLEDAVRTAEWAEERLDALKPESFVLTFFGGEPLLNMPVVYYLAERLWHASEARGVRLLINVITNGLLLTPEIVDRLNAFGLNGVKITLDGDHDTHNRMRPLRGGQGTFDRIIHNVRQVAGTCRISIGGNFDETSVDSYPALLDFLKEQEFADQLARVTFKPIIREPRPPQVPGFIPLTVVGTEGKPLNGTCMTSAGAGASICDSCNFLDEKMSFLRDETKKRGFATADGVHMGPCEIHARHSHTIGPDGALYACPGFTGDPTQSTGHIDGRRDPVREQAASRFARIAAWRGCDDCAFIPVCAGGCSVAAHTELGSMDRPNCHKTSFEAGVIALAMEAAAAQMPELIEA